MEITVYFKKNMFRIKYNIAMSVFVKRDNSVEAHKQGWSQFKKNWYWSVQFQLNSGIGAGIVIGRY